MPDNNLDLPGANNRLREMKGCPMSQIKRELNCNSITARKRAAELGFKLLEPAPQYTGKYDTEEIKRLLIANLDKGCNEISRIINGHNPDYRIQANILYRLEKLWGLKIRKNRIAKNKGVKKKNRPGKLVPTKQSIPDAQFFIDGSHYKIVRNKVFIFNDGWFTSSKTADDIYNYRERK